MRPPPTPANYLRLKRREQNRQKTKRAFSEKPVEYTTCPECGGSFSFRFLVKALSFTEDEKIMGGRQIVCPFCTKPLWLNDYGKFDSVVVKMEKPEIENGTWERTKRFIRALVCQLLRKIKGLPPSPPSS